MSKSFDNRRETLVTYLHCERDLQKTADTLKITKPTLTSRLVTLRKLGVAVPPAAKANSTALEIAQLNNIINKWKKENGHGQ